VILAEKFILMPLGIKSNPNKPIDTILGKKCKAIGAVNLKIFVFSKKLPNRE
jgi:hypothetical protein